ncbi:MULTISPECIES: hypothetical protein [Streptomyces]|uniref:hypothetical protein n=1 Tax=Streptomyces TaxID=1883 RepID=UPI001487F23A|nr:MULTISPECIES: hypothetical protein [Streptomyces]
MSVEGDGQVDHDPPQSRSQFPEARPYGPVITFGGGRTGPGAIDELVILAWDLACATGPAYKSCPAVPQARRACS